MDTNKMREQFEQWAKDRYNWHLHDDARDSEDRTLASWNGEIYGNRIVEGMWQSWQASRESLVIELPEPEPFDISAEESLEMDLDEYEALEARHGAQWQTFRKCKKAIEAQGLKVEP